MFYTNIAFNFEINDGYLKCGKLVCILKYHFLLFYVSIHNNAKLRCILIREADKGDTTVFVKAEISPFVRLKIKLTLPI